MIGNTLIVTRPEGKAAGNINCPGMEIVNVPVTRLEELPFDTDTFRSFNPEIVIVTSARGADTIRSNIGSFGNGRAYISIGKITGDALRSIGLDSMVPDDQTSSGIVELIRRNGWKSHRIALLSSQQSNMVIRDFLLKEGYDFKLFTIYRSVPLDLSVLLKYILGGCLGIIITSSQEAEIILKDQPVVSAIMNTGTLIFAIGKTTADTINKSGYTPADPVGKSVLKDLVCQIREKYLEK